ncbi:TPA: PrgI family protein [Bacillus nitratireducens]|uniref:PrgI family protein n=1 Tax=Bacillus thuringiensis TaxID=1428 RepID=A0AAW9GRK0_BACTU|nr:MULTISPECIES: PrgI family protein [Bacillus cereus group]MDY0855050.1 PrgI family protein [Bacillus thuringiensis]MDY4395129.1 PrgI family protein [Bacillus thuringiensis]MDY7965314.1 PrgI family protein [Bacillus thuringiensis]BCC56553.1 conjugal transfer protein [Bacillus cereus]BCD32818.1 conjugal transfer protein [Bacillus cereus]
MNNNFVVSIPKELKTIKSKLFFGLTKRQLIGFSIALAIGLPVFFLLKSFSVDVALYGLFFTACPAIFATIFTKDGMPAETWIKLYLEYKYLNPQKRYFKVSKRNVKIAAERNMMNEKRKVRKTKSVSGVAKTN